MKIILNSGKELSINALKRKIYNKLREEFEFEDEEYVEVLENTLEELQYYIKELEKEKGVDEWHQ